MSTPTATEVFAEHGLKWNQGDEGRCLCGYWLDASDDPGQERIRRMHASHQLSKLSEHGYSIVQLPKPEAKHALTSGQSYRTFRVWASDSPVLAFSDGDVSFDDVGDMTVDDARELGLALLAAAAAAEEDQ